MNRQILILAFALLSVCSCSEKKAPQQVSEGKMSSQDSIAVNSNDDQHTSQKLQHHGKRVEVLKTIKDNPDIDKDSHGNAIKPKKMPDADKSLINQSIKKKR